MAEQENANQGAIPPKVTPITKAEGGASPISPAGVPRPITVRLKPVAAAGATPAPAPSPKATSRVPVPDLSKPETDATAPRPVTVRLRPLTTPAAATPVATPDAAPAKGVGSTQTISQVELSATAPIVPIAPIATTTPSQAQVQAAKSKTSRITLDAAIGAAPLAGDAPKTIRLKRPTDLGAPAAAAPQAAARKTSRIPDSALPTSDDSAAVTQKKTLKIKRPGAAADIAQTPEDDSFPDGMKLTPIGMTDLTTKQPSSFFTTFAVICAVAAAVVVLLLTLCLGAHNIGPDAGKNSLASIKGPELPWPGRL